MSEDEGDSWEAAVARSAEAFQRQMEPLIRSHEAMRRQLEALNQASEAMQRRFEPLIRGNEALRRQMEPLVRGAEQLARTTQWPKAASAIGLPLSLRVAFSVSAEMQAFARAPGALRRDATITGVPGMVTAEAVPGTVTGTGELAMPPMGMSGQGTVEEPSSGHAERNIGQMLALVLVLIAASGLLGVQGPDRAAVDHYLTVISLALPIAVYIWNKNNKPK